MPTFLKHVAIGAIGIMIAGMGFSDTIENSYGNTIVATDANGSKTSFLFDPDGRYVATMPDGSSVAGTHAIVDGKFCLTPDGGEQLCGEYTSDMDVGDSWTQANFDGSEVTFTIVQGRN